MPGKKGYRRRAKSRIPRQGNFHKTVPGRLRVSLKASDTITDRIGPGSNLKKSEFFSPASASGDSYAPTHQRIILDPNVFGKDRLFTYAGANTGYKQPLLNLSPAFFYQFGQLYQNALIESVTYTVRVVNMGPQATKKGEIKPWSSVLNHYFIPLTRSSVEPLYSSGTQATPGATGWYYAAQSTELADSLADTPGSYCRSTDLNSHPEVTMKKTVSLYYAHNRDPNRTGTIMRSDISVTGTQAEAYTQTKDSSNRVKTTWTHINPTLGMDNEWPALAFITTCPFIDYHNALIERDTGLYPGPTGPSQRFLANYPDGVNDQEMGFIFQVEITAHYDVTLWGIRNVDADYVQA